jgi:hypothetical protein
MKTLFSHGGSWSNTEVLLCCSVLFRGNAFLPDRAAVFQHPSKRRNRKSHSPGMGCGFNDLMGVQKKPPDRVAVRVPLDPQGANR